MTGTSGTGVEVYTLYSSSTGNSTYVTDGQTSFLIDAGYNLKKLTGALGMIGKSPDIIQAVFVTHEHTDHIAALRCLCKKYGVPVHAVHGTAEYIQSDSVVEHSPEYTVRIGGFTVCSFVTSHDSEMSVGYKITHDDGTVFATATDMGCITQSVSDALRGCRAVILESNYDEKMLACGPYPAQLKRRIASSRGHLSNLQSSYFLTYLYTFGTRRVLLAHISPENNTPQTAYEAAERSVTENALDGMSVECAHRFVPTKLI